MFKLFRKHENCGVNSKKKQRAKTRVRTFLGSTGFLRSSGSIFNLVTKVPELFAEHWLQNFLFILFIFLVFLNLHACLNTSFTRAAPMWKSPKIKQNFSPFLYICLLLVSVCHYNRHWRHVGVCVFMCVWRGDPAWRRSKHRTMLPADREQRTVGKWRRGTNREGGKQNTRSGSGAFTFSVKL